VPDSPTKPTRRPLLDRILRATFATLALVVAILALAEWIAGKTFDQPIEPYTPHPLFHLVRTPHYKQKKLSIEEPPYWFDFEANALGFRGKKMQKPRKDDATTYRIFFVGASTTENMHLPEEKTFAGLVETRLDETCKGSPRIEVSNCGIAGFGIARSLSLVEHRILNLDPDLIVVLDAENDFMTSIDERFDPANGLLAWDEPNLKDLLVSKSRLFAVLNAKTSHKDDDTRRFFDRRRARARAKEKAELEKSGQKYYAPEVDGEGKPMNLLRFLPLYERYLGWMALVCKDANIPVVFMTQPTLWKEKNSPEEEDAMWMSDFPIGRTHLSPAKCAELMAAYNASIKKLADLYRIPVVDLAAAVPRDLAHFCDDAHLTAAGNVSVADAILETVFKDGKLPGRAK
jgi:hypothetical protein